MVSVERVLEYTNIEAESSLESSPGTKDTKLWNYLSSLCVLCVQLNYFGSYL